jgi:hypothetical protein
MKFFLSCPECGHTEWTRTQPEDGEPIFRCETCGALSQPEDMCTFVQEPEDSHPASSRENRHQTANCGANEVCLPDGNRLIIARNSDPAYDFELFVDVKGKNGNPDTPIAIIRPCYVYPSDATAADDLHFRDGCEAAIVKNRFEVLVSDGEDDFDKVEVFSALKTTVPYFTLREKRELGMVPSQDYQNELCYIPLYDGYGISAVFNPAENEVYVGIKKGIYWHQNIARFRYLKVGQSVACDAFEEPFREYKHAGVVCSARQE